MADYYSENGDEPVTDDELRSYFPRILLPLRP